jgi:prevent-host-death family protein
MITTTMSSRAFNQDTGGAKSAAAKGPVVITDRGKPSHVLMTYADYRALIGTEPSLADMIADPASEDIAFDPARLSDRVFRPADFD